HQDFMFRNRDRGLAAQLLLDGFDDVVWHKRFPIVLSDVAVSHNACLTAQIAGKLSAVIVFNNDRAASIFENVDDGVAVYRHQPANLQLICRNTLIGQNLTGFFNDALGGSPANQSDVCLARSPQFGRGNRGGNAGDFPHALLHHSPTLARIGELVADQNTILIVFVAGRCVSKTGDAGDGARRNPTVCDLVALVSAVARRVWGRDDFSAIYDGREVQVLGVDAEPTLRQQEIRKNDTRALEAIRNVENFGDDLETVANIKRAGNHA